MSKTLVWQRPTHTVRALEKRLDTNMIFTHPPFILGAHTLKIMTARKLDTFFSEPASPLNRLAHAAQRLNAISRIWETVAPIGLARSCRAGRLDDGVLTLFTDNGAIASKMKQQLPSILEKIQQRGGKITGIQVDVQVKIPSPEPVVAPKTGISEQSLACLAKLGTELSESPLKEALTNLIRHHGLSK